MYCDAEFFASTSLLVVLLRVKNMNRFPALIFVTVSFLLPFSLVGQELSAENELQNIVDTSVSDKQLPGLVIAIAKPGNVTLIATAGVRKWGEKTPIAANDKMHLGSCTKAITATMIAKLVEQKKLKWKSTIAETIPDFAKEIHADFHSVTLEQLLAHRGGVSDKNVNWWNKAGKDITERRRIIAIDVMKEKPKRTPGTRFEYSNLGYAVASLFASEVTGKSWEELTAELIFEPLEMSTAGFGPPGNKDANDQPWGHVIRKEKTQPIFHDNAPALGPAGTIHCSIGDWAKFVLVHADANHPFLKTETRQQLHRPLANQKYAMGWIVVGKKKILTHSGSNTLWFCSVIVNPETETVFLAATNIDTPKAEAVVNQVMLKMLKLDQKRNSEKKKPRSKSTMN